ncbi:MAG: radical SAM protein [bacterium]|nr:radical SAM protein [bacterium]
MITLNGLAIEVTTHCNFRCKHCCITDFNLELPFTKIEGVLDEFISLKGIFLQLTGGEVLLHPDFFKIVAKARRLGLCITICSNGSLITNSIVSELKGLGVFYYSLGIYGASAATYEAVTGVSSGYERAIRAIRTILENNCYVGVGVLLTNDNIQELDKMVRVLSQFPLKSLKFNPLILNRRDGSISHPSCHLSEDAIIGLLKNGPQSVEFIVNRGNGLKSPYQNCNAGLAGCYITADGNIYPCPFLPISAGNIYKESLAEIWNNSPVFLKLRNATRSSFVDCCDCSLFYKCKRCLASAYFTHGDIFKRPDFICKVMSRYYGTFK